MDWKNLPRAIPQALLDAVRDPARRDQTVALDGIADGEAASLEVRHAPEPGVSMRIHAPDTEGPDGFDVTVYEPSSERPPAYPAALPYMPGLKVTVMRARGDGAATATATWWSVPDVEAALAGLRSQSAAAGWTAVGTPVPDILPGMRMIQMERGETRRILQATDVGTTRMIMLADGPADRM